MKLLPFAKKQETTDQAIFQRIVEGDEKALAWVYKKYYKLITKMVISNSGSLEEGLDVYQEGLVVLWQKARSGKLQLTSRLSTYLYGICQNIWYKELNRRKRMEHSEEEAEAPDDTDEKERQKLVEMCLDKLGERCKKILMLYYFDGVSMQQIATELNLATTDTAKTQKYKCMKRLEEMIKDNKNIFY